MAFYLIDYENIKNISGCDTLNEQDTIVFFYSQNANTLTFDLHTELMNTSAKKEYFLIRCGGKNALDFQLSSYVGFLLSKFPNEKIYIVSRDKGFESILFFWHDLGFDQIALRKNIGEEKNEEMKVSQVPTPSHNSQESVLSTLEKHAPTLGLSAQQCTEIVKIVNTYKTRQAINNNLMKLFRDSDKVGKITKLIKQFLTGKK